MMYQHLSLGQVHDSYYNVQTEKIIKTAISKLEPENWDVGFMG
jgi:hypothetical protein